MKAPVPGVFVSYSHKDKRYLPPLKDQLTILNRKGYVDWWTDQEIVPGEDWRAAIGTALEKADVILLLVSTPFLAYIFGEPVKARSRI